MALGAVLGRIRGNTRACILRGVFIGFLGTLNLVMYKLYSYLVRYDPETGFVGLISFVGFLAAVFAALSRAVRSASESRRGLARALSIVLLVFVLQMNFESLDGRISDYHLWLIAGMAAGLGAVTDKTVAEEEQQRGDV